MREVAYVNGRITDLHDAVVSINDRGLQFGDGVYEVVRSYDGRLWAFERHMRRFESSLRALSIDNILTEDVARAVQETYQASGISDAVVYYNVTRGVAEREYDFDSALTPTLIVTVRQLRPQDPAHKRDGVAAITHPDLRWRRVDVKSLNLLGNMMAHKAATDRGAFEAILHVDGVVNECSSTSLFIVVGGRVVTRERGPNILSGVTRDIIIECAEDAGIEVEERPYTLDELFAADEAIVTGTSFGACSVVSVDGRQIGAGAPGLVWRELDGRYARRVKDHEDAPRD